MTERLRVYVGAVVGTHRGEHFLYSASWIAHSEDEARGAILAKIMRDKSPCTIGGVSVAVVPDEQIDAVASQINGRAALSGTETEGRDDA